MESVICLFIHTRNAQKNKKQKYKLYYQHFSCSVGGQRGAEQFLDHMKAMKTPVVSYRLKGKDFS